MFKSSSDSYYIISFTHLSHTHTHIAAVSAATDDNSISAILDCIGLLSLVDIFEKEKICTDILLEMGQQELKEIGITAYGHRHKILKAIEKLNIANKCKRLPTIITFIRPLLNLYSTPT